MSSTEELTPPPNEGELVQENTFKNVEYCVYKNSASSPRGEMEFYTLYLHLPEVAADELNTIVRTELEVGFSYGPDAEGWIGTSTLHPKDIALDSTGKRLKGDSRTYPDYLNEEAEHLEKNFWLPQVLTTEAARVIDDVEKVGYLNTS